MKEFVFFDSNSNRYITIHDCPFIATVNDMGAYVPWCCMVKDFPEHKVLGKFISHCSKCSYWRFSNED